MERTSSWSLRARLSLIATAALLASLLFGGVAMYWAASIEEDQIHDARLEHLGSTVLAFIEQEVEGLETPGATPRPALKTRPSAALLYRYQVWSKSGALLLRSYEAPADKPLMGLDVLGFHTLHIDGEEYRGFAVPTRNKLYVVQVVENVGERWAQTALISFYYVGFLLLPLGLVALATWLMLRRSLHSIDTMADQLRHRNPLDLTPIQVQGPPRELLPILRAVDLLFARVGHALSVERRFTSVAAHEMRTPLGGLRAHAQLATFASSPEELQDALKSLMVGADRAAHLIDQLLDLARIESLGGDSGAPHEAVDLEEVWQGLLHELAPRAVKRQIALTMELHAPAVNGHAFALSLLLRNLVANAINYTPAGGTVQVSSTLAQGPGASEVLLRVDDSGPGIPAHERERAFERFNRLGQTKIEGVGLGLSIVLSVVKLHDARIQLLDSPLGGLRVQVVLAAAPARPQRQAASPTSP
jgi:signal transduction histidine kinase